MNPVRVVIVCPDPPSLRVSDSGAVAQEMPGVGPSPASRRRGLGKGAVALRPTTSWHYPACGWSFCPLTDPDRGRGQCAAVTDRSEGITAPPATLGAGLRVRETRGYGVWERVCSVLLATVG